MRSVLLSTLKAHRAAQARGWHGLSQAAVFLYIYMHRDHSSKTWGVPHPHPLASYIKSCARISP